MESPSGSTSTRELLRILGQFRNSNGSILSGLLAATPFRLPIQAVPGTTTDSREIWLSVTQIGLVPSGLPGAGNTVVEAILSITECVDNPADPDEHPHPPKSKT